MLARPVLALSLATLLAVAATAAPPEIKTAEKVSGDVGAFIPLRTETTGKFTRFVVIDKGLNVFPADLLSDKKATVVTSAKAGTYRVLAFTGNADGPSEPAWIVVTVGTPTQPPPNPDPDPDPDPMPMPKAFYFLVVRQDGPAAPAFTKTMAAPEWNTLRAAGHKVKDRTSTEAAGLGVIVPAANLPAVVTLVVEGNKSTIVRPAVPLPTTGTGILDLPKGIN